LFQRHTPNPGNWERAPSLINGSYTSQQKIELVELLWRVAYANEALHSHEEYLVRKVADLLYVPHSAFIATKHKARKSA
jgi:uncharacterized tellurite resistance protein B-like protein